MTWTFPMHSLGFESPTIPELRALTMAALQRQIDALRSGACPIAIAPAPAIPAAGWEHWHQWPELFLQLTGESHFATPTGVLTLLAGRCLLFPPRSAHVETSGCARQQFSNLVFCMHDGRLAYHLATVSADGDHPRVLQPDSLSTADAQLGQVALLGLARAGADGDEQARAGWLLAFCAWVHGTLATAPPPGSSRSERVRRACELVTARLSSSELSVAQLGAWVGCHPDHLARLFRRETGETLVGYLRRCRLERARELCSDPALKIADIARLVGLPDPAYFSRVFRQAYGQAPSVARSSVCLG